MRIEEHCVLAPRTTFQIGGAAHFFASARTLEEVREALSFAREKEMPVLILGGGSNVLIDDGGFKGLVLHIAISGLSVTPGDAELIAAAGEPFDSAVRRSVEEGLWGLENLSGIPGSVGGAVVQNAGAYGAALSQALAWVEALDEESGEVERISNEACAFGYRDSLFKHAGKVVLRAGFALSRTPSPNLSYKDLRERFGEQGAGEPALAALREAVLTIRGAKFPNLSEEGTAGSFFKNPLVLQEEADKLRALIEGLPVFFLPEAQKYKVPLAHLLDKGLHLNGFSVGGARLFERQPLVVAAKCGTSSGDVKKLAALVAKKVFDAYGITIEPEVLIVPHDDA